MVANSWYRTQREERMANSLENPSMPVSASAEEFLSFFGQMSGNNASLPIVTLDSAMEVPAIASIVNFLPRTLANLPLHAYHEKNGEADKIDGQLAMLLNEAPNPEWSSFEWRRYMWTQVFTGGRGLSWIERQGSKLVAIWPMDPTLSTVVRKNGRKTYKFDGKEYPAADVIDIPFLLKRDQIGSHSPILGNKKTIGLALAMNEFAGSFFAGGGVPPYALEGPMPTGRDAFQRAQADIKRAIDAAKNSNSPFFGMPPGHVLKQIGVHPDNAQMDTSRLFQTQECSRIYNMPPVFVGDLSTGTMANTEQQDLHLVKHLIAHYAKQFEDECNLKIFGQRRRARKVKHNLDGVLRGEFKNRTEGLARAIQTGQITPNEARALENRPPMEHGDQLYIQGATVPLGTQPIMKPTKDEEQDDGSGEQTEE